MKALVEKNITKGKNKEGRGTPLNTSFFHFDLSFTSAKKGAEGVKRELEETRGTQETQGNSGNSRELKELKKPQWNSRELKGTQEKCS